MVLVKQLVVMVHREMDSFDISTVDAIKCRNVKDNGLSVDAWPRLVNVHGNGLFLKRGNDIRDGAGLLMGAKCPFKNIPILEWLL